MCSTISLTYTFMVGHVLHEVEIELFKVPPKKGGGGMQHIFQHAPNDSVRSLIWQRQLSVDEKFRPTKSADEKLFGALETDPKAVTLSAQYRVLDHAAKRPSFCSLMMSRVKKLLFSAQIVGETKLPLYKGDKVLSRLRRSEGLRVQGPPELPH